MRSEVEITGHFKGHVYRILYCKIRKHLHILQIITNFKL